MLDDHTTVSPFATRRVADYIASKDDVGYAALHVVFTENLDMNRFFVLCRNRHGVLHVCRVLA
jgi:hypothetical protein